MIDENSPPLGAVGARSASARRPFVSRRSASKRSAKASAGRGSSNDAVSIRESDVDDAAAAAHFRPPHPRRARNSAAGAARSGLSTTMLSIAQRVVRVARAVVMIVDGRPPQKRLAQQRGGGRRWCGMEHLVVAPPRRSDREISDDAVFCTAVRPTSM